MREVELMPFEVGHCTHPEAMTLRGAPWRSVRFPALAMLIRHPEEGPILFDTGYDPAFWAATEPFPERLYRWATPPSLAPGCDIAVRLRSVAVDPAELRHVVVSHFHADHVAGLRHFPNAVIHCARAGLAAVCSGNRWRTTRRGMLPMLLPGDIAQRARWFEDQKTVPLSPDMAPFETAADLLGDGSLLAIHLPGHCPGHWGLLVTETGAGPHFLIADAAWSTRAIVEDRPPPRLTAALLGDADRARATLHDLHLLRRRNRDVRITPSHCRECAAGWRQCGDV